MVKKFLKRELIIQKPAIRRTTLFLEIKDKKIPNITPKTWLFVPAFNVRISSTSYHCIAQKLKKYKR